VQIALNGSHLFIICSHFTESICSLRDNRKPTQTHTKWGGIRVESKQFLAIKFLQFDLHNNKKYLEFRFRKLWRLPIALWGLNILISMGTQINIAFGYFLWLSPVAFSFDVV